MKTVITELQKKGEKIINMVSDSPANQYQNKKLFWLIQQIAEESFGWYILKQDMEKKYPIGTCVMISYALTLRK